MQICIVGTGISGLAAASLLHAEHDITVLEAEDRVGGHSHTVDVLTEDGPIPVDTGFMVYNEINYPELTRLLAHLGVATDPTDMSFSVSIGGGRLEYGCSSIRSLFAQPANLVSPSFLGMLRDIQRFNRVGRLFLDSGLEEALPLGGFLERQRLGRAFRHAYILPMAAAIWSAPPSAILDFPAHSFLRFFDNHGLLSINGHHRWRTVRGGSREYVRRLTAPFRHRIVTGASVRAVQRSDLGVHVQIEGGRTMRFDRVVLATHADQTARMLVDADAEERRILGTFRYQPNTAFLHQDVRLMPRRRAAWASWNYLGPAMASSASPVSVTYWMNSLQRLGTGRPLLVSLNPLREPDPAMVHATMTYDHPVLDQAAIAAQALMPRIQGRGGIAYAGAWLGYGFHEDGLASGLAAARGLGGRAPWHRPHRAPAAAAGFGLPDRVAAQAL